MSPHYRPNKDLIVGMRNNRDHLDDIVDHRTWTHINEYAAYTAIKRTIATLDLLQRRIDGWADDADHNRDVDPKPLRDTAEHLRDLLREMGAEEGGT